MECRHFNIVCAVAIAALFSAQSWAQQINNAQLAVSSDGAQAPAVNAAEDARQSKNRDQISTVIVTANKRNEDASKIPTSLSVLSGDDPFHTQFFVWQCRWWWQCRRRSWTVQY